MQLLISLGHYIIAHATDLAGILIPPVVDYLNKDVKSSEEKYIVTLLLCFGFAIAFHWSELVAGSSDQAIASFLIVLAESQTIYKLYFKNSGLRASILDKLNIGIQVQPDAVQTPPQTQQVTP